MLKVKKPMSTKAYKTSDGQTFYKKKDAVAREEKLAIKEMKKELSKKFIEMFPDLVIVEDGDVYLGDVIEFSHGEVDRIQDMVSLAVDINTMFDGRLKEFVYLVGEAIKT